MSDAGMAPVIVEAIDLLSTLSSDVAHLEESQRHVMEWGRSHPDIDVGLSVDRPPASTKVGYDLILAFPGAHTIALTLVADEGIPWSADYSDHWAANYVVTVNSEHVTVQQVLRQLALLDQSDNFRDLIVNRVLEAQAVLPSDRSIVMSEVQEAADNLRRHIGLTRSSDMTRFLDQHGMSKTDFAAAVAATLIVERVRRRLVDCDDIERYFAENRSSFDRVRLSVVYTSDHALVEDFVASARSADFETTLAEFLKSGSLLNVSVDQRFARDIPTAILATSAGEGIIGPVKVAGMAFAAKIAGRLPATLDADTIAAIRSDLLARWLAEARDKAAIEWHWK
jgi:putative peptide maturation system protein